MIIHDLWWLWSSFSPFSCGTSVLEPHELHTSFLVYQGVLVNMNIPTCILVFAIILIYDRKSMRISHNSPFDYSSPKDSSSSFSLNPGTQQPWFKISTKFIEILWKFLHFKGGEIKLGEYKNSKILSTCHQNYVNIYEILTKFWRSSFDIITFGGIYYAWAIPILNLFVYYNFRFVDSRQ